MNVTAWVIVANVLYLVSYTLHDILWLRVLTVAAAFLVIPYYYLQPSPLLVPIEWNFVFIAINVYWIVRLILERRPVHLTAEEQRLRELSFPSLTPREALNLFKTGIWETLEPGMSLVEHDRAHSRFSVILSGMADVFLHGVKVEELGEGQFVGEIDTRADEAVDIDVLLRTRACVMCWDRSQLRDFLKGRPDVSLALERSVGSQLRERLDTAMESLRDHSSPNP
jgi:CRP-like cAMP-binding protein